MVSKKGSVILITYPPLQEKVKSSTCFFDLDIINNGLFGPTSILFDPSGRIIAKNLRVEELEKKMREIFK